MKKQIVKRVNGETAMMRNERYVLTPPENVRVISDAITPALVELYVRAFLDEPIFHFVFHDDVGRNRCVPIIAEKILRLRLLQKSAAFATYQGPGVETPTGLSFWFSPDRTPSATLRQQLSIGLAALPFQIGLGPFRRLLAFGGHADSILARALRSPHWVLDIIGVHPDHQRRGIGRDLMDFVFEASSRTGVPCYVVTHNERNVRFYEKYGFRIDIEERGAPEMPTAWGLRRPA